MRRLARVFLLVIGSIVTLAGLAAALLAGPDDTVTTGERELTSETVALVSSASLFDFMGPSLHVAATADNGREVFVGVAHEVDVNEYLGGIAYDQVARLRFPRSYELERVDGAVTGVEPEPASRDWWYVQSAGPDRQVVDYPLGADPVNAVVMGADGDPPLAVSLELGLQIDNLFVTALLVLAIGLGLILVAIVALRRRRRTRPRTAQSAEPARQAGGRS
jgi:hypothetical protein